MFVTVCWIHVFKLGIIYVTSVSFMTQLWYGIVITNISNRRDIN